MYTIQCIQFNAYNTNNAYNTMPMICNKIGQISIAAMSQSCKFILMGDYTIFWFQFLMKGDFFSFSKNGSFPLNLCQLCELSPSLNYIILIFWKFWKFFKYLGLSSNLTRLTNKNIFSSFMIVYITTLLILIINWYSDKVTINSTFTTKCRVWPLMI